MVFHSGSKKLYLSTFLLFAETLYYPRCIRRNSRFACAQGESRRGLPNTVPLGRNSGNSASVAELIT
jgi:hypothetical protein